MKELLSGEIVWLWEINSSYYDDEDQATIAAEDAHIRVRDVNMVQALKQNGEPPNYYLIRKVDISNQETLRKSGLAKLTPLERKALGL